MKNILYARLSMALAATYQVLLIILIFIRPDLPPYSTTISEWAIGKYGWLMQFAFFCSALSYLFLFLSIKNETRGTWGKIGLILLFICFLGTTGVGAFVSNRYPPDLTITNTLIHTISGTMAMALLPLAALLIDFNIAARNQEWANQKNRLKLAGFLPLLAFVGFIVHLNLYVIPLGKNAVGENVPIGYPPRILFLAYHLWVVVLAINLIKVKQLKNIRQDI